MQAASPGTYVGRRYRYLTVLRKQVYFLVIFFYIYLLMDMDSQAFMTICEGNQQPIHKEKF